MHLCLGQEDWNPDSLAYPSHNTSIEFLQPTLVPVMTTKRPMTGTCNCPAECEFVLDLGKLIVQLLCPTASGPSWLLHVRVMLEMFYRIGPACLLILMEIIVHVWQVGTGLELSSVSCCSEVHRRCSALLWLPMYGFLCSGSFVLLLWSAMRPWTWCITGQVHAHPH